MRSRMLLLLLLLLTTLAATLDVFLQGREAAKMKSKKRKRENPENGSMAMLHPA